MELDDETSWATRAVDTGNTFAANCRNLCNENPSKYADPLSKIMNDTMTELWDHGFSQTEIRHAFLGAIDDLPRYAANKERRS